jgi:hypothetical protein
MKTANFLKTYLMANPDRSTYAFCIDKEVAGNFLIGFKANKNSPMQTWVSHKTLEKFVQHVCLLIFVIH